MHYEAGPPYHIPGRRSGMIYVEDDVERGEVKAACQI